VFVWAALLPIVLFCATPASAALLDPSSVTKFVTPLPQPPIQAPDGKYHGQDFYDVNLEATTAQILPAPYPATPVFTFDGVYPGPTFLVQSGVPNWVFYHNNLPAHHMFAVDTEIPVMKGMGFGDTSRFVAHLHGGDVEAEYDGWCLDAVKPGNTLKYYYPNSQRAATLWYHDHSCGITRLNAYAGIAGYYIIIDPYERSLGLPSGAHELGIALQDRTFNADGSLYYPEMWQAEFFGDVAVVNGKSWPVLEVDPAKYRIHFLAGGNDRFWNIKLLESDAAGNAATPISGPGICQIGSDQGLLPNAVMFNDASPAGDRLLMEPGARYDVVIDFAGQRGKYFLVHNNADAPFDGTFPPDAGSYENPLFETFLIHVKDIDYVDNATCPMSYSVPSRIPEANSSNTRDWGMFETLDGSGMSTGLSLNHMGFMEDVMMGIVDTVQYKSTEIWRYINTTMDVHPMHIHLVAFNILDRTPFDVAQYKLDGSIVFTGAPELPAANEAGFKDEVMVPPGYVARVIAKYDRKGKYVTHCHILGHEENDMMLPFVVAPGRHGRGGAQEVAVVPALMELAQNSPEPFHGNTSISYGIGYEQRVKLSVYNALGQEVKTLVNGTVTHGLHSMAWDGTSNSGSQVAAGTYFYKLETQNGSQTRRATLVR
jgi:spore coat protein A, manganese oxidase